MTIIIIKILNSKLLVDTHKTCFKLFFQALNLSPISCDIILVITTFSSGYGDTNGHDLPEKDLG